MHMASNRPIRFASFLERFNSWSHCDTWSNCNNKPNHEKISSNFRRAAASPRARRSCGRARPRLRPPPRRQWAARRRRPGSGAPSALHCLTRPQAAADEIGALLLLAHVPQMKLPHPRSCARTSPLRSSIACSRPLPLPALFAVHTYYPHPLTTSPRSRSLSLCLSVSLSLSPSLPPSLSLPLSFSPKDDSRPFRRPPRPCRRRPPRAPTCIPLEGRVQVPIYFPPTRHTPFFSCSTGILFPGLEAQRRQRPLWYQATFGAWLLFSMSTLIALRYISRFSQPTLPQIPHTLFSEGESSPSFL